MAARHSVGHGHIKAQRTNRSSTLPTAQKCALRKFDKAMCPIAGMCTQQEGHIMDSGETRVTRMMLSLEGLSIGDAFGECFFDPDSIRDRWVERRLLPPGMWTYTDDTQMALSVASVLLTDGTIDQDRLAESFTRNFDPTRGYGAAMYHAFPRVIGGAPWRAVFSSLFGGEGSCGNGAAMRVAPVGAYFADDLSLVVENARRSAQVTHWHPEAAAGAIAVAVATALAWQSSGEATPTPQEFIDGILAHTPEGATYDGLVLAASLEPDTTVEEAVSVLGNGGDVMVQDTVPFAVWCAASNLDDFEGALWQTVSGRGDIDTNCAIVGGIVAAHVGWEDIPGEWVRRREPLPDLPI